MRATLAFLFALLLLAAPFAVAEKEGREDDDDKDEHSDRAKAWRESEHHKRDMRFHVDGKEAQIKLSRESNGSEDEVKIRYNVQAGTMKVSYETENATVETETELKVRFKEVLEFRDLDGDGAYDRNETIVARHHVPELKWRLEGPDDVNSSSGVPGKRLTGIGDFRQGGSLIFVLYVYGDFAVVNGTTVRPSEAKIDIILDHFPYQANDTRVALLVKSEQEREIEVQDGDASMYATSNGFAAFFTWADSALVDNVTMPVKTTILKSSIDDDGKSTTYAIAYPRGTVVNHDPVLGIQSDDAQARSVPMPGAVVLAATVALVALAASRRRA